MSNVEPVPSDRSHGNNAAYHDNDVPVSIHAMHSFPPASSTYCSPKSSDEAYVQMEDCDDRDLWIEHTLSIEGSVMTTEGLADPEGFWIVCSVVLISDMTRGVTFPIMWPLVEDLGGNHIWLGYVVGSFSLGRVIASPVLGRWSIEKGYTKTLVASTTVLLVGCILFAHAYSVGSLYFLVFSQIVLGIGSATLGVTRSYVAEITATRQRTTYIALLTAVQYGAFTGTLMCAAPSSSCSSSCIIKFYVSCKYCSDTVVWIALQLSPPRQEIRSRVSALHHSLRKISRPFSYFNRLTLNCFFSFQLLCIQSVFCCGLLHGLPLCCYVIPFAN